MAGFGTEKGLDLTCELRIRRGHSKDTFHLVYIHERPFAQRHLVEKLLWKQDSIAIADLPNLKLHKEGL